MAYGGSGTTISLPTPSPIAATSKKDCKCGGSCCEKNGQAASPYPTLTNGEPDFRKMTNSQRIAYHKARWNQILG
jgi:hypothetical protein